MENKCYIDCNKVSFVSDIEKDGDKWIFKLIIAGCLITLKYFVEESAIEMHDTLIDTCGMQGFVPDEN